MTYVSRFLEYRRCMWFSQANNLESYLRQAWGNLPNTTDRIVERADGTSVMGMRENDYRGNGLAIHCARYTERQSVGVVDMQALAEVRLGERRPGNDENFLTSDFMALVSGDHILTLSAGQNAASARSFLQGLFRLASLHEDTTKFDTVRIADANELNKIEEAGVASIGLNVSINEATAEVIAEVSSNPSMIEKLMHGPLQLIDGLINRDDKASQIADSQKGTVKMLINIPKGDLEAARSGIDGIAEELVQDEDAGDYIINLRNGEAIKPGEIAVKKRVRLEKVANSVRVSDVWHEMDAYMSELRRMGQLGV